MQRTEQAVARISSSSTSNRSGLQITFVLIFAHRRAAGAAGGGADRAGAGQPARAADRPADRRRRAGARRRPDGAGRRKAPTDDELAGLSRAFNRMTSQLAAQRGELMEAYQPDRRPPALHRDGAGRRLGRRDRARRRTAGSTLPNRAASELLGARPRCRRSAGRWPTWCRNSPPLLRRRPRRARRTARAPPRSRSARRRSRRTLLVRIGADCRLAGRPDRGFVVTFDDITELLSAQRKAAWADVARRIAHEIKNPLTPIQLSAERLKRRYLQADHRRPGDLHAMHRHHHPPGRRHRPHGRRVLRLRPHAAAGDQARGLSASVAREALVLQRTRIREIAWRREHARARRRWCRATAGCSARR